MFVFYLCCDCHNNNDLRCRQIIMLVILFSLITTDVDECFVAALESSVICVQLYTQCVNTDGSFECVCVDGYEPVDGECKRKITNRVSI